jgi:hypothetical protein
MSNEEVKVMSIVDAVVANKEIAVLVGKSWKSGVSSKLKLASYVLNGFDNCVRLDAEEFVVDGKIDVKGFSTKKKELEDLFVSSLPFGKAVALKFKRIGGAEWLEKFDSLKLPNCYNTLDKLSNEAITKDEKVLDYIKERVSTETRTGDITNWIKEAEEAKEESSRPSFLPDPKTDLTKLEVDDNASNDNAESESVKNRSTIAFKVMIDTAEITTDKETYGRLVAMLKEMETIISFNRDIAKCEKVESVLKKMVKTIAKKDAEETEAELSLAA